MRLLKLLFILFLFNSSTSYSSDLNTSNRKKHQQNSCKSILSNQSSRTTKIYRGLVTKAEDLRSIHLQNFTFDLATAVSFAKIPYIESEDHLYGIDNLTPHQKNRFAEKVLKHQRDSGKLRLIFEVEVPESSIVRGRGQAHHIDDKEITNLLPYVSRVAVVSFIGAPRQTYRNYNSGRFPMAEGIWLDAQDVIDENWQLTEDLWDIIEDGEIVPLNNSAKSQIEKDILIFLNEEMAHLGADINKSVIHFLLTAVLNDPQFQSKPDHYLSKWELHRGGTEVFLLPQDPALEYLFYVRQHSDLARLAKLAKSANLEITEKNLLSNEWQQ